MSQRTIRIHLGAHKTASTYLQETLALNIDASAAAGLVYYPRADFRPMAAELISRRKARQRSRLARIKARLFASNADVIAQLKEQLAIPYDVTVSEENLLGEAQDCFAGALYPHAATYLRDLAAALPDRPVEIYLAVRSYPNFLSSLYAEGLKNGMILKPEKAKRMQSCIEGAWPRLVATLRSVFPTAKIIVWRYEEFARLQDDLFARLSAVDRASLKKPSEANILPSPSAQIIEAYLKEAPAMSRPDRRIHMRALRARFASADQSTRFTLWTPQEAAALEALYARDIEDLGRRDDVDLLA